MTTYTAQPGVWPGAPPCHCGAARRLHVGVGAPCPTAWRPDTLATAVVALRRAVGNADRDAVFVARGDVQRQLGHRRASCTPLCEACDLLLSTTEVLA